MRAASEGVEVAVGAPLLLVHCATQKPLCVEAAKVPTDYGIELEVGRARTWARARIPYTYGTDTGRGPRSRRCWGYCLQGDAAGYRSADDTTALSVLPLELRGSVEGTSLST